MRTYHYYIRLIYVMDLVLLHIILLLQLQLLLLQPASEVRERVTSDPLMPPLQPPRGLVSDRSEHTCPLNMY